MIRIIGITIKDDHFITLHHIRQLIVLRMKKSVEMPLKIKILHPLHQGHKILFPLGGSHKIHNDFPGVEPFSHHKMAKKPFMFHGVVLGKLPFLCKVQNRHLDFSEILIHDPASVHSHHIMMTAFFMHSQGDFSPFSSSPKVNSILFRYS